MFSIKSLFHSRSEAKSWLRSIFSSLCSFGEAAKEVFFEKKATNIRRTRHLVTTFLGNFGMQSSADTLHYTFRGTQRIVSVNYLFGRPLIPSDFLEIIVTLNFRDMRNLMSVAFGLSKLSFLVPKKGQLSFSERREDLKFSGLDKKIPNKFENTQVPLEYPNR